ncbi:MAG: hypothetical protein GYA69_01250 [Candidatus Moranbacteria bacterium]|nr:hypothetical protein [Candidatus Moranbacteria bacterium]
MEKLNSKDKQIYDDMKQCFVDLGMKIIKEENLPDALRGMSTFEYPGYGGVEFIFVPSHNIIDLSMRYADFQRDKLPALYELLNLINLNMVNSHFCVEPNSRIVLLRSGMNVTGYFLNKIDFKTLLGQVLAAAHTFFPLIAKLQLNDQTVQSIMEELIKVSISQMPPEFLEPNGKMNEPKKSVEPPFIVHACADMPAFPTHTHGLTELGMPEFLIDHLAFGGNQNGGRINASYDYFTKPENKGKLEAIKNGETVKLKDPDLMPSCEYPDPHVYCYRRVYPEFEMVKLAYCIESPDDIDPAMWFVQIYVEGDDFALTDEYYKGGIKW